MRGLNVMYDFMRRPSMAFDPTVAAAMQQQRQNELASPSLSVPLPSESPMTPMPTNLETYEVDDEFNLPISVAIVMLVLYMLCGAGIYCTYEQWTFFESFYFVFVSISTIGRWLNAISRKPFQFFHVTRRFRRFRARPSDLHDAFNHLSHIRSGSHIYVHQRRTVEIKRPFPSRQHQNHRRTIGWSGFAGQRATISLGYAIGSLSNFV